MQSQPKFFFLFYVVTLNDSVAQCKLNICTCEEWNIGNFRQFSPKLRFGTGQFQVNSPMMPT